MWIRTRKKMPRFFIAIFLSLTFCIWNTFFCCFEKKKKSNIFQVVTRYCHISRPTSVWWFSGTKQWQHCLARQRTTSMEQIRWNEFKLSYRRKCLLDLLSHSRQNKKGTSTNWEIKGTIKLNAWRQRKIFCKRKK